MKHNSKPSPEVVWLRQEFAKAKMSTRAIRDLIVRVLGGLPFVDIPNEQTLGNWFSGKHPCPGYGMEMFASALKAHEEGVDAARDAVLARVLSAYAVSMKKQPEEGEI